MKPVFRSVAACAAALLLAAHGEGAVARVLRAPVLVELYTAQGCATCPKANRAIGALAETPGVLPLTFSVDYWDYLGWSDTLAQPAFSERQRSFVQRLKVREIYTPEVVVEGEGETSALDADRVQALISKAAAQRTRGPKIRLLRGRARVAVGRGDPSGPLDVWLVRYESGPVSVKVKSGENKGETVTLTNAVRELSRLGVWRGRPRTYALPGAPGEGLKSVLILQNPRGGRVVTVQRLDGA